MRALVLPVLCAAASVAAAVTFFQSHTDVELKTLLVTWEFLALEALFALVLVTTLAAAPRLPVARSTVVVALVLAAFAFVLTSTLAPRTSRIYYDEQIYQGVGRNLSDGHRPEMCNEGLIENGRLRCLRGEYNKAPYGYPYLLSVIYRVAGVSETAAFRFNNVVAGLSVFVTVLLVDLLFASWSAAVLGGLAMAVLPMATTWSNTAAVEPSAALCCGAAILAAVHFARVRTTGALAWVVALGAFAIAFRPESALIVPLIGVTILLLAPGEFRRARLWWGAVAGIACAFVPLMHLAAVRNEAWGATGGRLSWEAARANFPVNFWFYFGDDRFPVFVSVAALVGLSAPGRLSARALLCVYALSFWAVFLFFYAGSYNYGADVRYSLMTYIPLAALAGRGFARAAEVLNARRIVTWSDRAAAGVASAVVLAGFLSYVPLVRAVGEEAWAARADVEYARGFATTLPPDSIVLTHNPSMFHIWGVSAAQLSIAATETAYVEQQLFSRHAGGVYAHWNFWCNVDDPVQQAFCRDALAAFPHELAGIHQERDYRYAFYRLQPSQVR